MMLPVDNAVMAKTVKERQEDLRARRLMEGMTEVRGVFLPPDLHATLKAEAKRLLKRRKAPKKDLRDSSEP